MNASKMIRKGLALTLMAALLLTMLPVSALAASFSAVVTASEMTVYKSASMTGTSATVPKGTVVKVLAYKNNIAKISYKGYTGYAAVSDMERVTEATAQPAEPTGENVTLRAALKVYQKASTGSKSMSVPAGTSMTVVSSSGGWTKLYRSGNTAYAVSSELEAAVSGASATTAPTAAPTATATPAPTATPIPATVTSSKLPVYQKADTRSKVLGTLKAGDTVNVEATSGNWARVEKDGNIGYALKANLIPTADITAVPTATATATATPQPAETSIPATVKSATLKVYKKASTGSTKLGTLKQGDTVNVQAISGNWAQIEKDGNIGYALKGGLIATADVTATPTAAVTPTPSPTATASSIPATVSVEKLVVYKKASTGSTKLGTLKQGDTVNVQAVSGSWARVEKDGNIGYCKKAGLTPSADVTASPSPSVSPTPDVSTVKFQATVTSSTMTVYASNSTSSTKLGTLKAGATVDVYAYEGDWAYIGVDSKRGYAKISCMSASTYGELSSGDSGDAVKKLNDALLSLGYYDGVPSSKYDATTTAAVKRLQAALNQSQTGTADTALQRILYTGSAPKSPILSVSLSKGDSGSNVQRIQQRLYALGYLSKSSSVDADYGTTTQKAVALFQTAAGLTANGSASSSVIQKLYSSSAPSLPSGTNAADVAGTTTDTDGGSTDNSPLSSAGQAKVETIIAAAKEKMGCKYVYGANGPSTFDCSGFTKYCYAKVGISLARSAYSLGYGSAGTKIAYSGLVRGDIVCFNTISDSDLSDHVGIYLGGGQFIHASSGKGQVVISDLTSGYYKRVFSWGKRFIN
ncbi:MAG: SH3 domain-containing protein [Clostridia bacterium]|nr:SH3 domain-containing protein [Clostridia bacterium]